MKLVVIEGPDGVGKTSVVNALRNIAPEWTYTHPFASCPPGLKALITKNDMDPVTQFHFMVSVHNLFQFYIQDMLCDKEGVLVTDRYVYSLVYQLARMNFAQQRVANEFIPEFYDPDAIIWVTAPQDEINKRIRSRNSDYIPQQAVYMAYQYMENYFHISSSIPQLTYNNEGEIDGQKIKAFIDLYF